MKISLAEFFIFLRAYKNNYGAISEQSVRFGQAFVNTYATDATGAAPDLFYMKDMEKAIGEIMNNYVDHDVYHISPVQEKETYDRICNQMRNALNLRLAQV